MADAESTPITGIGELTTNDGDLRRPERRWIVGSMIWLGRPTGYI
ncbi:MAG TPA: hypothetical protein VIC62_09175 [Nakamurella sp.]